MVITEEYVRSKSPMFTRYGIIYEFKMYWTTTPNKL